MKPLSIAPLSAAGGIFLLLLLSGHPLHSSENPYAKTPARGLAIYKPQTFQSDASANIVEYIGYQIHDTVTYVATADHRRITLPTTRSDVLLLPYPGRGEALPEDALTVISVAEHRFPQFRPLLIPLKSSWLREAQRPRGEIEKEISARQQNRSLAGKFANLWKIIAKPIRNKPLPSPTPASSSPSPRPTDLDKNLKIIGDYYRALGETGSPEGTTE